MSRLAAICAKLTGGALPTSTPFVSPFEAPKVKVEPDFNPNSASYVEKENERSSNGIKTSRTPTPEKPNADEIGVLKRTSLIAGLASGASKRKRQRPTSLAATETPTKISAQHSFLPTDVSPSTNDEDSMDGSERSLHIDIPDEQAEERDGKSNKSDAFEQYKKSLNNNRAASYVSGMYGITGDALASQSLIALAQKASTANTEMAQNTSGILSPASLSADSLNDSAGRTSLKDQLSLSKPKKELDFVKYMNRYSSAAECKSAQCMAMNYKDHYHCVDCKAKVFVKKEEMIRHYKWHKKRDDSLQHGFMRYSPFDDCTIKFGPCAHNKKQTHYHCVQPGCNKVYVSTSDVQMHANYHRKASAIFLEGFQRFRATEDCGTPNCDFYSQRTTHFHCRRSGCNFTFKNKADMEKHKTYHQKDEILSKDGFKKFMKYEHCPYKGCAYSKLSNHIHCMRPGCFYVLHSTSQLYPHKRKHEKKDLDFSCIKSEAMAAALDMVVPVAFPVKAEPSLPVLSNMADNSSSLSNLPESESSAISGSLSENICNPVIQAENQMNSMDAHSPLTAVSSTYSTQDGDAGSIESEDASSEQICEKSLNLTPGRVLAPAAMNWKTEKSKKLSEHAKSMMGHFKISSSVVGDSCFAYSQPNSSTNAELWKKYLTRYTANDPCNARCYLLYKDHYHCNVENCFNAFKNKDAVRDHARLHDNQERISEQLFNTYPVDQACPADGCEFSSKKLHYHCNWTGCKKSIACDDLVFARLNHFQEHELESRISSSNPLNSRRKIASSPDKQLVKRRGRPPKQPNLAYTDNQMEPTELRPKDSNQLYAKFDMNALCPDMTCMFRKEEHYHCTKPRCNSVTNRLDVINLHCTNFHNFISIPENYAYFDRNINCKLASCSNNHSSHYHCLRPGCEHSFIRHTTVASHDKKHQETLTLSKSLQSYNKIHILPKPDETSSSKSLTISMPAQSVETAIADQLKRLAEVAMQNQSAKDSQLLKSNQYSSEQSKIHSSKTIKATGTFFPQKQTSPMDATHQPYMDESSAMSSSSDESTPNHSEGHADKSSSTGPQILLNPSNNQATAMLSFLTQVILMQQQQKEGNFAAHQQQQQTMQQQAVQQQPFPVNNDRWSKLLGRMYASPQVPCGNVFCKKKNVEHYHCLECGTAFNKAHEARLKTHITKHSKFKFFGTQLPSDLPAPDVPASKQTEAEQNLAGSSVPSSSASLTNMFDALIQNQAPFPGALETNVSESAAFEGGSSSSLPAKLHQVMMQALQLQMVQTGAGSNKPVKSADVSLSESSDDNAASDNETKGYKRYSKGRECGYPKCAHLNSSEHYHCLRDECGFSVADESRLLQHTQRHEKLDKIMGEDFKLFKINSKCGRADCEYTNKAAHFHCLLCPFICTDASRILPHRKHHSESSKGLLESNSSMSVNS